MLTPDKLYPYQMRAHQHQCAMPETMLWLDVGLGKTVITLSSIAHLLGHGFLRGVLIVAPVRVCKLVWRQEATKWTHTAGLTFANLTTGSKRRLSTLLHIKADVYLINFENLKWLVDTLVEYYAETNTPLPFDGLVIDEISKLKNSSTKRVKALMRMRNDFKWATGLTASPAANGYKDLHGQYLVIDKGERLGTGKTAYMRQYYEDSGQYAKRPKADAVQNIHALISDITLEMSAEDYNPLPKLIENDIVVDLPPSIRSQYDRLEKDFFTQIDAGHDIEVINQASLYNKLLQFAAGTVYPVPGLDLYEHIHNMKLEALMELLDEMNGAPLLLAYPYRSSAQIIMDTFKHLDPINLTLCKSDKALNNAMRRWKDGDCPLMIGHPASMGHGIDGLQDSCDTVCWFGVNWSYELTEQFNGRVRRQGQARPVTSHRILAQDTMDMAQVEVLTMKETTQTGLRKSVGNYRKNRGL
jgi:SNF2 family DNA or RNA helicase